MVAELKLADLRQGLHVSYSPIRSFVLCPAKYGHQYVFGTEPSHRPVALVLGAADHGAQVPVLPPASNYSEGEASSPEAPISWLPGPSKPRIWGPGPNRARVVSAPTWLFIAVDGVYGPSIFSWFISIDSMRSSFRVWCLSAPCGRASSNRVTQHEAQPHHADVAAGVDIPEVAGAGRAVEALAAENQRAAE